MRVDAARCGVMAKGKRLVILSVRVDDALATAVKQLADADSRPVSNYIEVWLRKHVTAQGIDLDKVDEAKPVKAPKGRKT
jgi:predicted transcriptional regulator